MGKKYIIELEDGESVYKTITYNGYPMIQDVVPAPYTEPDLEQVRKEAYEQGRKDVETQFCSYDACKNRQEEYQRGLADAWEAARKICLNDSDGGLTVTEIANIFDVSYYRDAMKKYSAPEAIEKIRQYEQKQEEQIHVGDEVITTSGKAVVIGVGPVHFEYFYADGSGYDAVKYAKKTGRHFPEIAEVLRKMKETE